MILKILNFICYVFGHDDYWLKSDIDKGLHTLQCERCGHVENYKGDFSKHKWEQV